MSLEKEREKAVTVAQLISELQKLPQDSKVLLGYDGYPKCVLGARVQGEDVFLDWND
jgi:hypothetical protein